MPKELPYMRWYPSDFDEDEDVKLMTDEQAGFYVRCLNHSWKQCGLPSDLSRLARLFFKSEDEFSRLWEIVGGKFSLNPETGRLVNKRQEEERNLAVSISASRSQSAKQRSRNSSNLVSMPSIISSANAQQMLSKVEANAHTRAGARFVSVSESVFASQEGGQEETKLPTDSEADAFGDWMDTVWERHPKKKFLRQAQHELVKRFSRDLQARELFDRNHKLWCETVDWRKNNGSFCPNLAGEFGEGWITDEAWKYPPIREDPKQTSAPGDFLRRRLAELQAQKKEAIS